MCETMKEYIWPFGQLNLLDEKKYIWAMTKQMKEKFESTSLAYKEIEQWETVIAESISKSQEFLRPTLANEAIISLRDASRCLKFFHWLMQHRHEGITVKGQPISWIERALNIALSLSYYFRLDEAQRKKYSQVMSSSKIPWFSDMVNEEITLLSESFQKPAQVAFHKILKENLFVLFFCIVTETPMILVGEPGTSKTLSLRIVLDTLSYHNINDFHQKLKNNHFLFRVKPLHCLSFQGTRDCKPSAIEEIWQQAERYSSDKTMTTMLLFDEIGLAEQSQFNPLKILHHLLEHPKIAFVGISNWTLDAAKMNRMIIHSIPNMSSKDLENTVKFMFKKNVPAHIAKNIENTVKIYEQIIQDTTDAFKPNGNKHFFGARDFYSLAGHQVVVLSQPADTKSLEGYLRNFGGFAETKSRERLQKIFVNILRLQDDELNKQFKLWTPVRCVQSNLTRKTITNNDSLQIHRHCMIISDENYSWQSLLDYGVLNYKHIFLFGSCFPHDTYSNIANYSYLNKIIDCMDTGKTVILNNLDNIYESLYDMLNQRYQQRPSEVKKKGDNYCRVALGTESRDCRVDPNFRCIVVVNKQDAYSPNMPTAFLSRFEKQFISYRNVLPANIEKYHYLAENMLRRNFGNLSKLFCGYHKDTIYSALLCLAVQKATEPQDSKDDEQTETPSLEDVNFDKAQLEEKLLDLFRPLCRPEEIVRRKIDEDVQFHSLVKKKKMEKMITDQQKSAKDQMLMVITNDVECNIPLEWDHCTKKIGSFKKVSEFEKKVKDFFSNTQVNKVLILQHSYASNTENLLEQVIIILQIEHNLFYRVADNQNANKLIVLLIHNQESYFPLIFRRKWKLVYIDHLLSTKSISSKDLTNSVADTINKQCKSNLVGCACRAFGKLHFPRSMDCLNEKKRLSDLFEKEEFKGCEAIIEERLKILLPKATRKRSIEEILRDLSFQNDKKEAKGPFFEKYQSIVDALLILTFVNILLVIYENGGFKVLPNFCLY
ncbi:hypothetical protein RFI_34743, partial [Reticulomyxa filosa]